MNTRRELLRALLDDSPAGWSGVGAAGDRVAETLQLAKANGVLLRAARRLGRRRRDLPGEFEITVAAEELRAASLLGLIKRLAELFAARGVPHVFLTTLEGYPDVGRDVDVLVLRDPQGPSQSWLDQLGGKPLPQDLSDRLAAAARYATEAGEVDVHTDRLGRVGEDAAFARAVVARRRLTRAGSIEFFGPAPADAFVLQGMRRMYTRRGIRVSDIIATVQTVRRADFEWAEALATAERFGVLEAVSCYLGYVERVHHDVLGTPLLPPAIAQRIAETRWGRMGSRHGGGRFPTPPVSARLYLRKLSATVASRRWEAAGRLCLIPVLGAAAAVRRAL
jgi:hypothetical protein